MPRALAKDVSDRWTPVWHAFFYVMIAAATAIFWAQADVPATDRRRLVVVGLVVVLSVWHWLMIVRQGRGHRERPRQVATYLAGAIALSSGLLAIDTVFLMVAMSLYNQVFAFLIMRWAVPAAAVLTGAIGLVVTRTGDAAAVVVVVVGSAAALLFSAFLQANADQNEKRRELIEELERTRDELALTERLAGISEERARIARELHDTVTQQLVGIVMQLEAAGRSAIRQSAHVEKALVGSLDLAREALGEARRLVWADRPAQLEGASLSRALSKTCERVSAETGIAIEIALGDPVDDLSMAHQTLVLRSVQEALANVRKHSRARSAVVTVGVSGDLLAVDVHDDGIGLVTRAVPKERGSGFGLRGLRERVESLGGSLSVESSPEGGTTVAIHVPLRGAHP